MELGFQPQPFPLIVLNGLLKLLLAADQVVLGEEETLNIRFLVDKSEPLLHILGSLLPRCLIVKGVLNST